MPEQDVLQIVEGLLRVVAEIAGLRVALRERVRRAQDAGQQRAETRVVLGLRLGQADRAVGPAVKGALVCDHVRTSAGVAGQLERALAALGAGVGEEYPRR